MTTWPQNAYVGQRVVCIMDAWDDVQVFAVMHGLKFPTKPTIYTIRSIDAYPEGVGIKLEEIVNKVLPSNYGLAEISFNIVCFKPVDESKLDQFRKHLIGVPSYDTV